jgi:hypothetical protein
VKNGHESIFSPPSVPFQSNSFINPSVTVPALEGYDIEWTRSPCTWFITLQRVGIQPIYTFTARANLTPEFEKIIDLSDFWDVNSSTLTMCLDMFVMVWNSTPPTNGTGGLLSILPDGRLSLAAIIMTNNPLLNIPNDQWWRAMGFTGNTILANTQIIADNPQTINIIGTGPTLVDVDNPCQIPNPPTSAPAFDRFNYQF